MSFEYCPTHLEAWIERRTKKRCATRGCSNRATSGAKLCKDCIAAQIKRYLVETRAEGKALEETNLYAIVIDDPFSTSAHAVKFGIAANPKARLKELQTGSFIKLKLYGFVPCIAALERTLHSRLRRHHRQGEWFTIGGDVRDVMGWIYAKKAEKIYEYCGLSKLGNLLGPK